MYQGNLLALDLAKNSHQACLLDKAHKEQFNRTFSSSKLTRWLSNQPPLTVAMETCSTAHHWARVVQRLGHRVLLVPTQTASRYRQGQKTNATDALAVGVAARQPNTRFVAPKTIEQQQLQSIERIRKHLSDHLTATSNMLRSLLAEFGLTIAKGQGSLHRRVPDLLEDAENELPDALRRELAHQWDDYLNLRRRLAAVTRNLHQLVKQHPVCRRLQQLEGVGPVNALGLYLALGDSGQHFKNGREAAACIGLTPKQFSTGDKVTLGRISRYCANKLLRANLIQGMRAVINAVNRRGPQNAKEAWLKQLMERRGEGRAAVALANKTIRLAWAMSHYGDRFKQHPNLA